MSADKLSLPHIQAIAAVLHALPADLNVTPSRSLAQAALVLEDAYVACALGLRLGLTLEQVRRQHDEIVAEWHPERADL